MALRACTTKAGVIDAAIEQLKQHLTLLRSKGTLVKDSSAYKKQLLVGIAEQLLSFWQDVTFLNATNIIDN